MPQYTQSLLWAAAMLLIALASLLGLISERAGDVMLIAALGGWVATAPGASRGSCRLGAFRP